MSDLDSYKIGFLERLLARIFHEHFRTRQRNQGRDGALRRPAAFSGGTLRAQRHELIAW